MIRVSDIMEKEIINVKNGKRMGFITDIDMDCLLYTSDAADD